MAPPSRRFVYNVALARYQSRATGRIVPRTTIIRELDREILREQARMQTLATRLRDGDLSLAMWEVEMRDALKRSHVASAALARGGWGQLSPADYGRVGRRLRSEYGYLHGLQREIARGLPLDGRFLARIRMYAQGSRGTYDITERAVLEAAGYDQERSVLHPADHCEQCVDQAALGWVPIGTCIPIGQRTCLSNCKCTIQRRRSRARRRRAA